MILTRDVIRREIEAGRVVIDPFLADQVGLASNRVRLVVDDDVVLALDDLRLVDREAGVLADLHLPILAVPAQVAMPIALVNDSQCWMMDGVKP